jgi:2-dehydropantoate 2-reductase
MRLLVYGAGNIGCLYAGKLATAGHDVTVLARGVRRSALRAQGVMLEDARGRRTTAEVRVVERLGPADAYDVVLLALPKHRLAEVVPILARNTGTPSVMVFGNNAEGLLALAAEIGGDRLLAGFPGASATRTGDVIRYVIVPKHQQPTTIGELDGRSSPRLDAIAAALRSAGFPVAICDDMDAWLKTHVVEVLPTVCALYGAGGDPRRLARSDERLHEVVRAIREGYAVLHALGVPITPANHRAFEWAPEWILVWLMRQMGRGRNAWITFGHAEAAREEWQRLADELSKLIEDARVPTPALDALLRELEPEVHLRRSA